MLAACPETLEGVRNRAILLVLADSGLRAGEVLRLLVEDWRPSVDRRGQALKRRHLVQILHRLSRKAGLPDGHRLHPHALRYFAATSWLRGGAGLDEVRRLLGHESLSTTLRYSSLVGADLQRAHRQAGGSSGCGWNDLLWGVCITVTLRQFQDHLVTRGLVQVSLISDEMKGPDATKK